MTVVQMSTDGLRDVELNGKGNFGRAINEMSLSEGLRESEGLRDRQRERESVQYVCVDTETE